MNMKFTIAIPAYKSLYLEEAIDSILGQSYSDFELLILDDASPYNLPCIVSKYDDPRIRFYRNERNVGALNVVDNWNRCLELAKGEYIICMGDDDCLCPDSLAGYSGYIDRYPECNIFHGATEMIDEASRMINIQEARPEHESVYSMAWHRMTRKREQFIGDFVFRTEVLRAAGGFYFLPLAWASDDISAFRIAMSGGIVNTSEIVFRYRVNSINITSTGSVKHKLEAIVQEKQWYIDNLLAERELSPLDDKYRLLISCNLDRCFKRKIMSTCADGFRTSFWSMLKDIRRYDLNFKEVCMVMILGWSRRFGIR